MNCRAVTKHLSPLLDERLEREFAVKVSEHLWSCLECNREFMRLSRLREQLHSLGKVPAPQYLRHLVRLRIAEAQNDYLGKRFRDFLELQWSRIRTTGRLWYVARFLGTASAFVFFFALCSATNPIYIDLRDRASDRGPSQNLRQQLGMYVLKNLGLLPVEMQRKPISFSEPRINDLYFLKFGESASRTGSDDSFSVFTVVDRSGSAKIQNVLEYPADSRLLRNFNHMLTSAQVRPASQNGRAVDSHLVLSFTKICVYD
jgi:hypothetical protein